MGDAMRETSIDGRIECRGWDGGNDVNGIRGVSSPVPRDVAWLKGVCECVEREREGFTIGFCFLSCWRMSADLFAFPLQANVTYIIVYVGLFQAFR